MKLSFNSIADLPEPLIIAFKNVLLDSFNSIADLQRSFGTSRACGTSRPAFNSIADLPFRAYWISEETWLSFNSIADLLWPSSLNTPQTLLNSFQFYSRSSPSSYSTTVYALIGTFQFYSRSSYLSLLLCHLCRLSFNSIADLQS